MRTCEICGAGLTAESGVCPSCGFAYSAEGFTSDTRMSGAKWGRIEVDLTAIAAANDAFDALNDAWREHEKYTVLSLLPGQFDRVPVSSRRFLLYGPKDVFINLSGLRALIGVDLIFNLMTDAELDEIMDEFNRRSSQTAL